MSEHHKRLVYQQLMSVIDKAINEDLHNRRLGAVLLVFPFNVENTVVDYISNQVEPESIVAVLRRMADRFEEQLKQKGAANDSNNG